MATATLPEAPHVPLNEAQRKIRHPLDRLRAWIRAYVTVEGALVLGIYLALWFWIGVALDYGLFKTLDYDWVQDMPWIVRAVVLLLLVAGLLAAVTLKVFMRLFTEFRDAALALVLEHRFPKILGDRLITAIELHDTKRAAEQGYSVPMIHQTLQEAAARVDQLPIQQVFNWKRLTRQTLAVVALTALGYVLAVGGFAAVDSIIQRRASVADGARDFHQVAGLWFQRNILLQDVIWPRKAFLTIVGWPRDDAGRPVDSISIGQNAPPQPIRVRAWQYVIADRGVPEGWRGMFWSDAPGFLDNNKLPEPPGDWQPRVDEAALSVDDVAIQLNRFDIRKTVAGKDGHWFVVDASDATGFRNLRWSDLTKERLGGPEVPEIPRVWRAKHEADEWTLNEIDQLLSAPENADKAEYADLRNVVIARLERYSAFRDALETLDERLADPGTGGRVRKLQIPRGVTVHFHGRSASNSMTLTTLPENEYNGTFTDLKETGAGSPPWTFTFRAHGEDYYTPAKKIIVVAAPNLMRLLRQERHPAYLYYQPNGDLTTEYLHGKKQLMSEVPCSIFGGETTRIDLPAGSDVTLTGVTDKKIARIRALKKRGGEEEIDEKPVFERPSAPDADPDKAIDPETSFRTTFKDVRQEISFVLEFTDVDGVVGYRSVSIRPAEDSIPDVALAPDIERKTPEGNMVTPIARFPFSGKAKGNYGLSGLRYAYTITPIDAGGSQNVDAALFAASIPLLNSQGHNYLMGLTYLNIAAKNAARAQAEQDRRPIQYLPVAGFEKALKDSNQIFDNGTLLNQENVSRLLGSPQRAPYRSLLKEYILKRDDDWVDAETGIRNDFPMARLKLLETDQTQRRYRVQLWLEGINTDVDSEPNGQPRVGPSPEKVNFIVVSEGELLSAIAKDEEKLYDRLAEAMQRLLECQSKLTQMVTVDLASSGITADGFAPFSVRADEIDQVLDKYQGVIKEALGDYQRIADEYHINQVTAEKVTKMNSDIIQPLTTIDNTGFPRTRNQFDAFHGVVDNKTLAVDQRRTDAQKAGVEAKAQLQAVIDNLQRVLDSMEGLISLDKQIKILRDIEIEEQNQRTILKSIYDRLQNDLFGPPK